MVGVDETGLLVLVADRAEVAADDLPVGVLADVVLGHLKHSEVEVGDWAEGAAGDDKKVRTGTTIETSPAYGYDIPAGPHGSHRRTTPPQSQRLLSRRVT